METLRYYQPQDSDTLIEDYSSYSVWVDKHICMELFPNTEILTLQKSDIEVPTFEDTIQIVVPTLTLTQVLAEYALMGYDSNDMEEEVEIHIVAVYTKQSFIEEYETFVEHLERNKDDEDTLAEELSYLSDLKNRIEDLDRNTLISFEFLD